MAKFNSNGRGNKTKPTTHRKNATGYAKRHSLKAKTLGLTDVYEYAPDPKTRRSKVALEISRDEASEFGLDRRGGSDDEDGQSDGDDMQMKPRLIGETGEGEMIDSADDEDIDSDAAFEESDDERYAGFSFKHKVRFIRNYFILSFIQQLLLLFFITFLAQESSIEST